MKLVYRKEDDAGEWLIQARQAETDGDLEGAVTGYRKILTRDKFDSAAWQRLMILLRKQKRLHEEIEVINKAIITFKELYAPRPAKNKTINTLSGKLNRAFGLTDKKGDTLYDPEPLAGWKRRKELLVKRIKK